MTAFRGMLPRVLRSDATKLLAVFAAAVAIAYLFRDGSSAEAVANLNPASRARMGQLSAPDLQGNQWSLANERGSIVLVNFWASWCPPCRAETPGLVRFAETYRDNGVKVVGISMDEDREAARRFVSQYRIPYTVVLPDDSSGVASSIQSLPTSFLIDREGRIAKTYMGAIDEAELIRDVRWLQSEK